MQEATELGLTFVILENVIFNECSVPDRLNSTANDRILAVCQERCLQWQTKSKIMLLESG